MAQVPPLFLNCVVALGTINAEEKTQWVGTGFFYGRLSTDPKTTPEKERRYHIYLVTNKHVISGHTFMLMRLNPRTTEKCRDFPLHLVDQNQKPLWFEHPDPDVDVTVTRLNAAFLDQEGMNFNFFESDKHVSNVDDLRQVQATEGDSVFVLGYPMGIVPEERQYVICRRGCIARIRDVLDGYAKDFLVDAFVFPGNSGGPVIASPEGVSIMGTVQRTKADLIGIVKSYVPYLDVAVSSQTGRPRVSFEENSGLTSVVPVNFIQETIEMELSAALKEEPIPQEDEVLVKKT